MRYRYTSLALPLVLLFTCDRSPREETEHDGEEAGTAAASPDAALQQGEPDDESAARAAVDDAQHGERQGSVETASSVELLAMMHTLCELAPTVARDPDGGGVDNDLEDGGGALGGGAGDFAAAALKLRSDANAQRGARDFREVSNEMWAAVYASDPDLSRHLAAAAMATSARADEDPPSANDPAAVSAALAVMARPWLEDALVGVLSLDAIMFVWDHCFILGWRAQLPLFCADVVLLLRAPLLAAASTHDVQHVVREYGPDLLTRDVRAAFHARFMVQFSAGGRAPGE